MRQNILFWTKSAWLKKTVLFLFFLAISEILNWSFEWLKNWNLLEINRDNDELFGLATKKRHSNSVWFIDKCEQKQIIFDVLENWCRVDWRVLDRYLFPKWLKNVHAPNQAPRIRRRRKKQSRNGVERWYAIKCILRTASPPPQPI